MRRAELEARWYEDRSPPWYLRPPSWLFGALSAARRALYQRNILSSRHPGCPVIVVGNISVGGTGKTPLVIWLADLLQGRGWRPGIVTRGYGGRRKDGRTLLVTPDTDPGVAGEEPVLIARRTGLPVAANARRIEAARYLTERVGVNVVISDDGLQHYGLARDLEICLMDGARRLGNGWLLPAGPLREPPSRLKSVDFVVVTGQAQPGEHAMTLVPGAAHPLDAGNVTPLAAFKDRPVHGVAGIGNPERFFSMLEREGLEVLRHPFPDHHAFRPGELQFGDGLPVLMTEKDAVRLTSGGLENAWYVPVRAELPRAFRDGLLERMPGINAR